MSAQLGWFAVSLAPWSWRHAHHLDDEGAASLPGASAKSLGATLGVDKKTAEAAAYSFSSPVLEKKSAELERLGLQIMTRADAGFPDPLRAIYDPPPALYFRGNFKEIGPAIALVGSRQATPSGKTVAVEMAAGLAAAGVTVVSGLARGIDGAAHRGALKTGRTWAVLGNGLDRIYPVEHRQLAADIVRNGAILSEYPPGVPPRPLHFPARNRLISGLCQAVVIVEAAARSGALITADFALEHGREVFAVPGPVRSRASVGCHRLLQQGAGLVTSAADVIEALELLGVRLTGSAKERVAQKSEDDSDLTPPMRELLESIPFEPTQIDDIIGSGRSDQVISILTELELEGRVARCEGGAYCRLK